MPRASFSEIVDFLADRAGQSVYIEIGIRDPTLADTEFAPLRMYATLGKMRTGEDLDHDRRVVSMPLGEVGVEGEQSSRLFFDEARITDAKIHIEALRVEFHDSFQVTIAGAGRL